MASPAAQKAAPAPSKSVDQIIADSAATPAFKVALTLFSADNRPSEAIRFNRTGNPPVKVLRAILGLLESHPDLPIEAVEVAGASGCSDYRGSIRAFPSRKEFRFVWDCAWRARQLGWEDHFGYPDQARAAREFGHRCFESFAEVNAAV